MTAFDIGAATSVPGARSASVPRPEDTGRSPARRDEQDHRDNAICLGGPCHGMFTHIDQDIGTVTVGVPDLGPEGAGAAARYRVTRDRIHHPGCAVPVVALHWAGSPAPCHCESRREHPDAAGRTAPGRDVPPR